MSGRPSSRLARPGPGWDRGSRARPRSTRRARGAGKPGAGLDLAAVGAGPAYSCALLAVRWLLTLRFSLGVDTYAEDPICEFALTQACYPRIGKIVASLDKPTLFVMEG